MVVEGAGAVPAPWTGLFEIVIDRDVLDRPSEAVALLHEHWVGRRPVVVRLLVDAFEFRTPRCLDGPVWAYSANAEVWHDRLHFLVWANAYDARRGAPVWWWGHKARRLGAGETQGEADVELQDGTAAFVDGGPRAAFSSAELGGAALVHRESVEAGVLRPAPQPVDPSAELAPDQLAAVGHHSGPARVVAPAGSGKTRVLTERLRHVLGDRGWERGGVLAVAYNVQARDELAARTEAFGPRVQTLNGLAYGLLSQFRGRPPRLMEERAVRNLIEELAPVRRRRANTDPIAPYIDAMSLVRLGLRDPDEVENSRDDVPGLAALFDPYREELARRGEIDFDEQIYGAVETLLTNGQFRADMQRRHRHLLVDEFQDLTPAHVLLLRLLSAPTFDVFGVGDDDQTIYGYNGATPRFLTHFDELFPGSAHHTLEVNYRCPVAVVKGVGNLLGYNRERVEKRTRPGPKAEPSPNALAVVLHPAPSGAAALVEVVQRWLEEGVTPSEVAVLVRVNSLLLAPHVALGVAGIPVASELDPRILERTGMRAALAYLRIGADPSNIDPADVVEILRRPSRGLPQWFPDRMRRKSRWTIAGLRAIGTSLSDKDAAKLHRLCDDLDRVKVGCLGTTAQALAVIANEVGLAGAMSLLDSSKGGNAGSNVDDLEALSQLAGLCEEPSRFEFWLRERLAVAPTEGGVLLATVHRVKGREWDRVAVFGATDGLMPHRLADDMEEERRVLHVAVTRGRHRVTVLADASRPTPFLAELDGTAVAPAKRVSHVPDSLLRPPAPKAAAGDGWPVWEARSGTEIEVKGGYRGTLADWDGDGAVLAVEGGRLRVRWGSEIRVDGVGHTLARPGHAMVVEALRAWRAEKARTEKKPAYIYLNDATVRAVAASMPSSPAELRTVPGIGPSKLEQFGEDILSIVEAVEPPSCP